jgi:transcriptional regulator with XRE-family HTH domain
MDVLKAFGVVLRKLRVSRGLTQEQLGFEANLRRTFISSLELGEKQPSLETIHKIADALDMPMSRLILKVEHEIQKVEN